LYYRLKGTGTWHQDQVASALPGGHVKAALGIHLGKAGWQARVMPDADTLTSRSNVLTSTMGDRTHFQSVFIQRSDSGSRIQGQITDVANDRTFAPMRGLKVRLYYRAAGTRTWHFYTVTRTITTGGRFRFRVLKGNGFAFQVRFPAQGPFLASKNYTLTG
jgi:hypothetical protein